MVEILKLMLGLKMKFDQDLCLNLWYDLNKLLWSIWTQSSGPLCLWQCFILRFALFLKGIIPQSLDWLSKLFPDHIFNYSILFCNCFATFPQIWEEHPFSLQSIQITSVTQRKAMTITFICVYLSVKTIIFFKSNIFSERSN